MKLLFLILIGPLCGSASGVLRAAAPIAFHASYVVRIEEALFNLEYDWSEFDYHGWDFGRGSYTERRMTDCCFARQLTPRWAIVVRLPGAFSNNSHPVSEVLLIDSGDPGTIRCYKDVEDGQAIDGLFSLVSFAMSSRAGERVDGRLSARERKMIADVNRGHFATVYGCTYQRAQWVQLSEVRQRLADLHETTLLGHRVTPQHPGGFRGLSGRTFLAMVPQRTLFTVKGGVWMESGSKLAVYRRGQFKAPRSYEPFRIEKDGRAFLLEENSLYLDGKTGSLTLLLPRPLDELSTQTFENPPGPL